jgi:sensor histidine kinase YesM
MARKLSIQIIFSHLLFWILFFGGWYFLRYQDFSTRALAAKLTAIKVIDLAVMIYISNYLLVPQLLYKKKYILFGACYVVMVFCFSVLKMKIEGLIMHNPGIFTANFKGRIYDNIIPHFLLVSTGVAYKLVMDYAKAQKRLRDIMKEKAEAELDFLKAQMNPHFLFNALNSVYFLIDQKNSDARNALHTLSEMLRYQLYETGEKKIQLNKEISFLKEYITVQRLRRNNNFQLELNISVADEDYCIEPLLLIPFVENAFKHLSHFSNGKRDIIYIQLNQKDGKLDFKIENTVDNAPTQYINNRHGIGLSNVKRRLELLYPSKHEISIKKENEWHKVNLILST